MANDQLVAAYHAARGDYEGAKSGSRAEMFTKFLVARGGFCPFGWGRLIRTWSTSGTVIHPAVVIHNLLLHNYFGPYLTG